MRSKLPGLTPSRVFVTNNGRFCHISLTFFMFLFRSLIRKPGYTLINLFGLTVGLACCLLILLFVRHESAYDRFHPDGDRLFRVMQSGPSGDWSRTGGALPKVLENELPGVETVVRMIGPRRRL